MRKVREEGGAAYQFEVVVVNIIAYDLVYLSNISQSFQIQRCTSSHQPLALILMSGSRYRSQLLEFTCTYNAMREGRKERRNEKDKEDWQCKQVLMVIPCMVRCCVLTLRAAW